ncbi:MAG TPA: beta-ketoacyl synthase N-terminal-like domain-containing protein, partial [Gemmatimonadaceae bacterium]|nr:beta-ketoacyl synthase N-terminal-like domain-containing protein [Gemmatimonadaceae bacterium]
GLDSADLLELSDLLSRQFKVDLEPAFFFEYRTCDRIVAHLTSRFVGTPAAVASESEVEASDLGNQDVEHDVAIIGIATRLPGGISTVADFWTLLKEGRSAIGSLPAGRWEWPADIDPSGEHKGIDRGGFLERLDTFDASFFRISPKEAELMDPQQRILMELAWQTIEDAGYTQQSLADTKTGVFIGASGSDYLRLLDDAAIPVDAHVGTGNSMAILANRLSYFFDFNGPSLQIDTACSSSLVALQCAMQSLRSGESSQALVGGINLMCHPANTIAYYKSGMLSHDGACKTFDSRADGYVRSEGAVMILIKPLKRAEADGDAIYAVIKGTAVNHGGLASGLTVPNPEKQATLLQAAWEGAGVSSSTITYIEMHGTGTPLGDPIEVDGIRRALAATGFNHGSSCALSSVKTNLGHLEAAAGLAGLLKVVLCLRHRELPATVHLQEINPHVHLDGHALHVVREHQNWPKPAFSDRRRAGVSSFGFGGANAHAVLEEYRPTDLANSDGGPQLFVLSAKTDERLSAYAARYVEWLSNHEVSIADLAHTLQVGRQPMEARLEIVATDKTDLIEQLKLFCSRAHSKADSSSAVSIQRSTPDHGRRHRRVHLPTYPFAAKSYWFKPLEPLNGFPHPLVQRIIPDSSNCHFTSTFDGCEFFLRDHEVSGHRTLPGVTHLEMVRKALEVGTGQKLGANSSLCFTSVVWAQPFQVTTDPKTLHIEIRADNDGSVRYEIYSQSDQEPAQGMIHGQGAIVAGALDSTPSLDLASLQKQMTVRRLEPAEFYEHYRGRGINYGSAHRAVRELAIGTEQALARIVLPRSEETTAGQYLLHPSTVDAALQAGIALQIVGDASSLSHSDPILPFSADSIEVFSPTTAVMWAWVTSSFGSLDIVLCDESGRVCLRVRGFHARRARGNRPTLTSLKPVWTPFHPAMTDRSSIDRRSRVLIFGAADGIRPALRQ